MKRKARTKAAARDPLVGNWFHSFGERDELRWQGLVVARVKEGLYLVETYSYLDGTTVERLLARVDEMKRWRFYETNEQMKWAYEQYDLRCRASTSALQN